MKPVVFIPESIAAAGIDLLAPHCECITPWRNATPPGPEQLREMLTGADAVIVRLFKVGDADLQRCPKLKVIGKHGVGVDNIDCKAAAARGVRVIFTPAANANAVAEHAVTLMLALARQIGPASRAIAEGAFNQRSRFEGVELAGKTLAVLGLGRIGSRVAEIAATGLAMKVLGYDPLLPPDRYTGPARFPTALDDIFPQADFISLHVPLTPQTKHLLNAASLARCKPACRIVNTSRGAVIDEAALAAALEKGVIAGAALDVFEVEPVPADHPLCRVPNLLLTPHISSSTRESLERMSRDAAQGVLDVLQGRPPKHPVNPEALP